MWVVTPKTIYKEAQRISDTRLQVPVGGNLQDFLSTTTATAFKYGEDWYLNEILSREPGR